MLIRHYFQRSRKYEKCRYCGLVRRRILERGSAFEYKCKGKWVKVPPRCLRGSVLAKPPVPESKPQQVFYIHLKLTTDCDERLTEAEAGKWALEQFNGCDVGDVELTGCHELHEQY